MVTTRSEYNNQSMITRSRVIGNMNYVQNNHKKKVLKKRKASFVRKLLPELEVEPNPEPEPKPEQHVSIKIEEIPPKAEYEVNIDFDEASREWRANKIKGPNCTFRYRKNFKKQMYKRPFLERGTEWI
jgi:hypothetical protein